MKNKNETLKPSTGGPGKPKPKRRRPEHLSSSGGVSAFGGGVLRVLKGILKGLLKGIYRGLGFRFQVLGDGLRGFRFEALGAGLGV